MKRHFNRTGYCNPDMHYITDPQRGLHDEIIERIRANEYFTIHAPRQSGKTTLLHSIAKELNEVGEYIAVVFSLETAGYESIDQSVANYNMCQSLHMMVGMFIDEEYVPQKPVANQSLKNYLFEWASTLPKPLVLLVDEVDALYDDVFVSVLRQFRDGFQMRPQRFPASIALVGLRDVRDYKMKLRPDSRSLGSGSPFNIKAESYRLENFNIKQVSDLLRQHTEDNGQAFSDEICSLIYDYTDGQPWLVNALAYELVNRVLQKDYSKTILPEHVELAKENLIKRRDTHLDSLADKLKETRVRRIVEAIINGDVPIYDEFDNDLQYTIDLGIVKNKDNKIEFANRIYKEVVPRVLSFPLQTIITEQELAWYLYPDKTLNIEALLKEFQQFYRENAESWIDRFAYKESGQHLLLMAFLQRILNGGARITREMAVGTGRIDVLIEFAGERFVLELKIKHTSFNLNKSLTQISKYLDAVGLKKGYLLIFEKQPSSIVSWTDRLKWESTSYDYLGKENEIVLVQM